MQYFIISVIIDHLMLISNNTYFYELDLNFIQTKKLGEKPIYNSFWIGIYLIFKGVYYLFILSTSLFNFNIFPNTFLILLILEIIKNLYNNKHINIIINIFTIIFLLFKIKNPL